MISRFRSDDFQSVGTAISSHRNIHGRKNWLFSESPEGAKASATVYTMVEMAKAHNLNIYKYLNFLLEQRPTKEWTDDQFEKLAPWSSEVQTLCNNN